MGWDAYAVTNLQWSEKGESRLTPFSHAVFEDANTQLIQRTGRGGTLIDGTLGSTSLPFLQCATPVACEDDNPEGLLVWPQETVIEANNSANWLFGRDARFKSFYDALYTVPPVYDIFDLYDEDWFQYLKWQVRLFLKACAENGLAIKFTW